MREPSVLSIFAPSELLVEPGETEKWEAEEKRHQKEKRESEGSIDANIM